MPLYDTTSDVIRKALRGLALAPATAATRAGLPEKAVLAATRGPADPELLVRLAPSLGLDPVALAGLDAYRPDAVLVGALPHRLHHKRCQEQRQRHDHDVRRRLL